MRPIKCRAWDETRKELVNYGFCLRFDAQGNCTITNVFGMPFTERKLIPLWWTGLVDRHGTEVYEGDIYRNLDNGLIGKFYYLNGPGGYMVYCREQTRDGSPYNMLPFALLDTTNFEVLGNIYENADLLAVQP